MLFPWTPGKGRERGREKGREDWPRVEVVLLGRTLKDSLCLSVDDDSMSSGC